MKCFNIQQVGHVFLQHRALYRIVMENNRENITKWKNKGNPPGSDSRTRQIIRLSTHERFGILFKIIEKQQEQINSLLEENY